MGIEKFAGVINDIINAEMDELSGDCIITSIPLGGYKDSKNGYPKIRIIFSESSPEQRILKILDLERFGNFYGVVARHISDYQRAAQDRTGDRQYKNLSLPKEVTSELEFLADIDLEDLGKNFNEIIAQMVLSVVLKKNKDIFRNTTN